jgi:hypothetical protein
MGVVKNEDLRIQSCRDGPELVERGRLNLASHKR